MGLIAIALVIVMIPLLVVAAIPKVRLGAPSVARAIAVGFVAGFAVGYGALVLPARLHCQPPRCSLATSPFEDLLWAVGFLAVPFVLAGLALLIRTEVSKR